MSRVEWGKDGKLSRQKGGGKVKSESGKVKVAYLWNSFFLNVPCPSKDIWDIFVKFLALEKNIPCLPKYIGLLKLGITLCEILCSSQGLYCQSIEYCILCEF